MTTQTKETYKALKERQTKEHSDFIEDCMFFAFSDEQFKKGMESLKLKVTDTDKIYNNGAGSFILRTHSKDYRELGSRFAEEHEQAIKQDTEGTGYILEMFKYELNNHEYCYTYETEDTLDCLDLTMEEVESKPNLLHGLQTAIKEVVKWDNENN